MYMPIWVGLAPFSSRTGCGVCAVAAILAAGVYGNSMPERAKEMRTVGLGGGVALELVWCPPGSFTMGSPANEPGRHPDEVQHRVKLTKGFWLGRCEVTQRQWEALVKNNPSEFCKAPVIKRRRFGVGGVRANLHVKTALSSACRGTMQWRSVKR